MLLISTVDTYLNINWKVDIYFPNFCKLLWKKTWSTFRLYVPVARILSCFFAVFLCSCIRRCNSETIFLVLCLPNWIISFVWCCELFVSKWHFIKLFSCCLQRCQVVKALFIYFPSNLHLPNLPPLSLQIFTSSLCWSYILDSILIKSHPLILFISQTASPPLLCVHPHLPDLFPPSLCAVVFVAAKVEEDYLSLLSFRHPPPLLYEVVCSVCGATVDWCSLPHPDGNCFQDSSLTPASWLNFNLLIVQSCLNNFLMDGNWLSNWVLLIYILIIKPMEYWIESAEFWFRLKY